MTSFTPGPEMSRQFRDALGRFATGVTVVTVATPTGPLGITANSFASVSLDPPLILWCPAKVSMRHDALAGADHFALHVIGEDQKHIARGFSRAGDAFGQCDWKTGAHDVPLIENCPVRFECQTQARIDGGDHTIMLGRVLRVTTTKSEPLVFLNGHYGRFAQETR